MYPCVFMISECIHPLIKNYLILALDPYCHQTLPTVTSNGDIRANTFTMEYQTSPSRQTNFGDPNKLNLQAPMP